MNDDPLAQFRQDNDGGFRDEHVDANEITQGQVKARSNLNFCLRGFLMIFLTTLSVLIAFEIYRNSQLVRHKVADYWNRGGSSAPHGAHSSAGTCGADTNFTPTVEFEKFENPAAKSMMGYAQYIKEGEVPNDKFSAHLDNLLNEKLEFYNKSGDMAQKVNFDDIFGNRENLDRNEEKLNKLATPDNLKQLKVDIADFVESKQNMHRLRKEAYDFQTNYKNLLADYKDCTDQLKNMNSDTDSNIKDREDNSERLQSLLKQKDQLEQELKDAENQVRQKTAEFEEAYDANQKEINTILDLVRNKDDFAAQMQNKKRESHDASEKIKVLKAENVVLGDRINDSGKKVSEYQKELEPIVKDLRDLQLELELGRKKLGILEQSRDLHDSMPKLCTDTALPADRYAKLMLEKIGLEKELSKRLAEIRANPDLEAKYEDDLLSMVKIDSDKTLFQEIMKSYLFLQQNAHSGKGEWETKSPAVLKNIKHEESMIESKKVDEKNRLSWIDSEEQHIKKFKADIERN